jgi:HEAT repeat protein
MAHVFVSYVREDQSAVDRLVAALKAYGVEVWRDVENIPSGSRWSDSIRKAIREGEFFLPCFSKAYNERNRTYMNEELALAIEELRLRRHDRPWLIPVLLDDSEHPDLPTRAGETLAGLQWAPLYLDWNAQIARLLTTIEPEQGRVATLIAQSDSKSARARIDAIDRLGRLGTLARSEPTRQALIRALKDSNDTVRAAAADAARQLQLAGDDIVDELVAILRAEEYYSSGHAARTLAGFGAVALPYLREALRSTAYGVAHHASEAIALVRDPESVPELIALLTEITPDIVVDELDNGTRMLNAAASAATNICEALIHIGGSAALASIEPLIHNSALRYCTEAAIKRAERIGRV